VRTADTIFIEQQVFVHALKEVISGLVKALISLLGAKAQS
jgi:hypothetical protein